MNDVIVNIAYVIAACLFIFGMKGLAHPRTAVRGNLYGALGMLIAVVVTLTDQSIIHWTVIIAGLALGGLLGTLLAVKIEMTSMPELVGLFNGLGGVASILVAGGAMIREGDRFPPGSIIGGVPAKKIAERDSSKANRQNAWQYHWNAQAYRRGEHRAWTGPEFEAWIKEINRKIENDEDLEGIRSPRTP